MDPLGLVAIGAVAYAGMKMSYATPNPRDRQIVSTKNLVSPSLILAEKSGPTIGHAADVTKMPIPKKTETFIRERPGSLFKPKDAVAAFGDVAPTRPIHGMPFIAQPNKNEVVPKYNNVNPIGQKINVGPGLGTMEPATGGFQQFYRVYPNLTNSYRLHNLAGGYGTPAAPVASGALAPASTTSGYGPITTGPAITRDPRRETGASYTGTAAGGIGYYKTPVGEYSRSAQPTLKDQTGAPLLGTPAFQAASIFDPASGRSGTPKPTARGQDIGQYVSNGLSAAPSTMTQSQMTSLRNDNNMIPQGQPDQTRFATISSASQIGSFKSTDIRGSMIPEPASAKQNLANNPLAISLA
jgi:hypothetical protein